MRLIDAEEFDRAMYHESFLKDSGEQKWDLGQWIRYEMYERLLRETPTIEAEPVKHGHWVSSDEGVFVPLDKNDCPERACYCSVCGEWLVASDEYGVKGKYCSNCGARMDEVEE